MKTKYVFEICIYIFSFFVINSILQHFKNHNNLKMMISFLILYVLSIIILLFLFFFKGVDNLFEFLPIVNMFLITIVLISLLVEMIVYYYVRRDKLSFFSAIVVFFLLIYLSDIITQKLAKIEYTHIPKLNIIVEHDKSSAPIYLFANRCVVEIEGVCNLFRVFLLIMDVLSRITFIDYPYDSRYFITEAIVTSLAIEKAIKFYYPNLGKRQKIKVSKGQFIKPLLDEYKKLKNL